MINQSTFLSHGNVIVLIVTIIMINPSSKILIKRNLVDDVYLNSHLRKMITSLENTKNLKQ